MKKYLLAAFLLVTCEVLAQTTTITATIPTYANGVAVITFNPGGGATPFPRSVQGAIDSSGHFSLVGWNNTTGTWAPSTTTANICAGSAPSICYQTTFPANGSSQDITSLLANAPVPPVGPGAVTSILPGTNVTVSPNVGGSCSGACTVSSTGGGGAAAAPAGFPQQLIGFSGPVTAFPVDGLSWDSHGIGGPSNTIFVNGEYWMAVAGYTTSAFSSAQAIGLWHGPSLTSMVPYSGNPVITNTATAWNAACIEGPDLNVDTSGNIYISFLGFSSACDSEGTGAIGIVKTTAGSFPTGWSAIPATPTIPQPANLNWLYRPFITEISGICYDYSNGGNSSNAPVIASFKTSGPCATTETVAADWSATATVVFSTTQAWEGSVEIQDPQVFQDPSGLWIMIYGGGNTYRAGYATTLTPASNNWVKLASNPVFAGGAACTTLNCGPWLPRISVDSQGDYWMFANYNNTAGMSVYKASGSPQMKLYWTNNLPLTSTNPAWQTGVDVNGKFQIAWTVPTNDNTKGFWAAATPWMTLDPVNGVGFFTTTPLGGGNPGMTFAQPHYPIMWYQATAAPANETIWRTFTRDDGVGNCVAAHTCFILGVTDDALLTVGTAIEVTRNLNTITNIFLDAPVTLPFLTWKSATAAGSGMGSIENDTATAFSGYTINNSSGATVGFNLYGNASESGLPFLASKYGVGGDSIPLCLFGTPSACAINIDASNVVSIPALTGTKLPVCETNGVLTAGTNTAGTISCP